MRQEGNATGTRSDRNNNPGNIWDGLAPGKARRIWPHLPIDSAGYVIYPSKASGRAALEKDLSIKVNRGMTLASLISQYAPPGPPEGQQVGLPANNTAAYIRNVSTWLGIPTDRDLRTVAAGWEGGAGLFPTVVGGPPAASSPPAFDPDFPFGRPAAPAAGPKSRRKK